MPDYPATSSPKRKRDENTQSPQLRIIARKLDTTSERSISSLGENCDSETQSPRSRVACSLGGLDIDGAAGVSRLGLFRTLKPDANEVRKQTALNQMGPKEIPESPEASHTVSGPGQPTYTARDSQLKTQPSHMIFSSATSLYNSDTSSMVLVRRPNHQQPASPPSPDSPSRQASNLPSHPQIPGNSLSNESESLHWQESEITGHSPSDPEDDGEGINGIGFKPTAAIARARSERRRKQLADYKSREDKDARDARAKRIALRRRKGTESVSTQTENNQTGQKERKVRFSEAERAIDVL